MAVFGILLLIFIAWKLFSWGSIRLFTQWLPTLVIIVFCVHLFLFILTPVFWALVVISIGHWALYKAIKHRNKSDKPNGSIIDDDSGNL